MSRKSKIDSAEKVKIVEHLLADEISVSEAARLTGVDKASIRRWRNLYLADGPTALMAQRNIICSKKQLVPCTQKNFLHSHCFIL